MCVNMRIYDGRFHSLVGIWDAQMGSGALAAGDVSHACCPIKSGDFARDHVRMISLL